MDHMIPVGMKRKHEQHLGRMFDAVERERRHRARATPEDGVRYVVPRDIDLTVPVHDSRDSGGV